jgi:hypothetical protein
MHYLGCSVGLSFLNTSHEVGPHLLLYCEQNFRPQPPNSLGFHMSGPVTHPNLPNKETTSGEEKNESFMQHHRHNHKQRQNKHFSHPPCTGVSFRFEYRKN